MGYQYNPLTNQFDLTVTPGVGGAGDVKGPATATQGRVAVYSNATGKILQNGVKLEADLVTGPASAVDNELAQFSLATGKVIKSATGVTLASKILNGVVGIDGGAGNLNLTANTTGEVTVNNLAEDVNFRVASGAQPNTFLVDSGANLAKIFPGTSAGDAYVGGILSANTSTLATTAVTVAEDLLAYGLPANTLIQARRGLRVNAWGTFAANANAKTIRLVWNGLIMAFSTGAFNGTAWTMEALIMRTGVSTQDIIASSFPDSTTKDSQFQTGIENETAGISLGVQAQNGVASAGDIVCEGLIVELL